MINNLHSPGRRMVHVAMPSHDTEGDQEKETPQNHLYRVRNICNQMNSKKPSIELGICNQKSVWDGNRIHCQIEVIQFDLFPVKQARKPRSYASLKLRLTD